MVAMSSATLWIKAFHIVFVASWFAGRLFLPRLFVNLAMVPADSHAERKLVLLRRFEQSGNRRSHTWFRIFNESSVLLFAPTVVLVVVKPF